MKSFLLWLTFASFLGVGRAEDSRGLLLQEAEAEANTEMVKWLEQIHQSLAEQSKKLEQRLAKVENQADTSARLYDFRCHYFQKRVKSFKEAAEKGDVTAQYNLGLCYLYGVGVAHNDAGAEKWFSEAAQQGHGAAKKELEDLKTN